MLRRATETVIVADHSKFEQQALSLWARWAEIGRLVTDRAPSGPLARALERARVEVTVAVTP